jgi:hypothetical protein
MAIVKCEKPEEECILTEHEEGQCFLPKPETDMERFVAMLKSVNSKIESYDNGYSTEVTFPIEAGCCGSEQTLGVAYFYNKDGSFMGIHHCD